MKVAGNGTAGNAANQLRNPWGVYIDSNYVLYIIDQGNHRVQAWQQGKLTTIYISLCDKFY
jgi:hypothetical protein